MKKTVAIFVSMIGGAFITGLVGCIGLVVGSCVGEQLLGSKEPMMEMVLGGFIGVTLGIAIGVFFGKRGYRVLTETSNR